MLVLFCQRKKDVYGFRFPKQNPWMDAYNANAQSVQYKISIVGVTII